MQNVAPTNRLDRRARDFLFAAAVVCLVGAALTVLGIGMHVVGIVVPGNQSFALYDFARKLFLAAGIGTALASTMMALRAVTWKTDNALAWELGEMLARDLDRRFVFIRNLSARPFGYIDAALISSHGVLVLRITKRRGEFFNERGEWLRRGRRGSWKPMRWNPTRDVLRAAIKVKAFLKDDSLRGAPVYAAVVFMRAAPELRLSLREPAVPVVQASCLIEELAGSYFAETRLDTRAVQRIVNLLYQ